MKIDSIYYRIFEGFNLALISEVFLNFLVSIKIILYLFKSSLCLPLLIKIYGKSKYVGFLDYFTHFKQKGFIFQIFIKKTQNINLFLTFKSTFSIISLNQNKLF